MADPPMLGARVRALRKRAKLTQAALAARVGVSASYLNLIENNRRPLTASMLLKLAGELDIDLSSFAAHEDARLVSDLQEVFSDPLFEGSSVPGADELRELAGGSPAAAKAVLQLYEGYRAVRTSAQGFAEQLHQGLPVTNPTEEVNDTLQRRHNYFEPLEQAAEELWRDATLDAGDVYGGLVRHLLQEHSIEVKITESGEGAAMRRYDPHRRLITLSEVLPPRSRRFQLAHQIGLILHGETFDGLGLAKELSSDAARSLSRVVLANYFAAAVLMPYQPFWQAATEERYDIELLAHRYRCSFEQVCHRLTTLRRPGMEGIPLHFIRIDIAGNISKRYSASGIRMPRFSGACPRWNVHAAFLTPGMFRVQLSRMPDGNHYFCLARTVRRDSGGYSHPHTVHSIGVGCEARHARQMVYADGIDVEKLELAVPVGVTCRTCEQLDCEQRVFPPVQHPLVIDENVRGMSFYTAVNSRQPKKKREPKR